MARPLASRWAGGPTYLEPDPSVAMPAMHASDYSALGYRLVPLTTGGPGPLQGPTRPITTGGPGPLQGPTRPITTGGPGPLQGPTRPMTTGGPGPLSTTRSTVPYTSGGGVPGGQYVNPGGPIRGQL